MSTETIPAGFRKDSQGRFIHEEKIKPIDRTRDELVMDIVNRALALNHLLREFKTSSFDDIKAFVELSAEQYRARIGGEKGNVTLMSFDGRYRVVRQIQEAIRFDERLQAAKGLIDECLVEWTEGARVELRALINDAFRVDQAGNIRTAQVMGLRRLPIEDDRWQRAMQAIGEAVQVIGSKAYVRVYQRDAMGKYQPITLDMAGC